MINAPIRHSATFLPVRTINRFVSRNGAANEGARGCEGVGKGGRGLGGKEKRRNHKGNRIHISSAAVQPR